MSWRLTIDIFALGCSDRGIPVDGCWVQVPTSASKFRLSPRFDHGSDGVCVQRDVCTIDRPKPGPVTVTEVGKCASLGMVDMARSTYC